MRTACCNQIGNGVIDTVDLTGNKIGDFGAERIARSLQRSPAITHMDLSGNGITAIGASWLARALRTNTTLVTLNLAYNRVETQGADMIANAIGANRDSAVAHLSLQGNQVGGGVEARIRNMTKANAVKPPQLAAAEIAECRALMDALPPRPENAPPIPPAYFGNLSIHFNEHGPPGRPGQ